MSAPEPEPTDEPAPVRPDDTLRLLVVDDEAGMRSGIGRILHGQRLELFDPGDTAAVLDVAEARTGEEALEAAAKRAPDILLLDQKLPGLSGLEVLSRLARVAPHTLTVMVTAYATLDAAVAATKRGAFDFLAKPFTPDELRATVRKVARQVILERKARGLAEEKRRIRFEFVAVLAHELKAPLAAVEGYLLTMQGRTLGDGLQPYLPAVDRCVVRLREMGKLVADLLDTTRIESGERRRELATLDLVGVAAKVIEAAGPEAAARGLTVVLHAAGPVPLLADRGELELVVRNLLGNAVKYNREGGRVEVSVLVEGGQVRLRVEDTGIGVSPADLPRLFHDFARVRDERTRHIPGSGLGLSTVRKVARLYGGDATMRSTLGEGSTVEVVLGAPAPG